MASDDKLKRLQRNSQKTLEALHRLVEQLHHEAPDSNHVSWFEKLIQWVAVAHFHGILPETCQQIIPTLFDTFLTIPVTFLEEWLALFDCFDLVLYRLKSLGYTHVERFWRIWITLLGRVGCGSLQKDRTNHEEMTDKLYRPVFVTCSIIIHLHGPENLFELCGNRAEWELGHLWSNPCFVELLIRCVVRAVLCLPHHAFAAHPTAIFFIKYALLSSISLLRRAGLEGLKALYLAKTGCDDIVELNGSIRRLLSLSNPDDGRRAYDAVLCRIKRDQSPKVDSHTQILHFWLDVAEEDNVHHDGDVVAADIAWVRAAADRYLGQCVREPVHWVVESTGKTEATPRVQLQSLAGGDGERHLMRTKQSESFEPREKTAVPKTKQSSSGSLSTFVVDDNGLTVNAQSEIPVTRTLTGWAEKHVQEPEETPVESVPNKINCNRTASELALEHVLKMPNIPALTARLLKRNSTGDVALPSILSIAKNGLQAPSREGTISAPLKPFPLSAKRPSPIRKGSESESQQSDEALAVPHPLTPGFQNSISKEQSNRESPSCSILSDRSPIASSEVTTISETMPAHYAPRNSQKVEIVLEGARKPSLLHLDRTENETLDNLSTDQSFYLNESQIDLPEKHFRPRTEKRLITKRKVLSGPHLEEPLAPHREPVAVVQSTPVITADNSKNLATKKMRDKKPPREAADSPSVTETSFGKKAEEVRMDLQMLLDRMQKGPRYSKDVLQAVEEFVQLTRSYPQVVESAIGVAFGQFLPLVYSLNHHVAAEAVAALETVMPLLESRLHLVASQILEALCSNMQNARTCDHSKKVFNQIINMQVKIERAGSLLAPLASNIAIMMKKNKKEAFAFVTFKYAEALKYAFPRPPKSQAAAIHILQFVKSVVVWITNYGDLHSSFKPEIVAVDALVQQATGSFGLDMVNKVCYDYRDTIKVFLSRKTDGVSVPIITANGPKLQKVVVRKSSLMAFKKQQR